jgi:phosphoesterase RecJ-like protein
MTNDPIDYDAFIRLIQAHQSYIITTHVNPDGDALGSEIGLAEWLLSLGKRVRVINHSPTPYNYFFLDESSVLVEQYEESKHDAAIKAADALLVLDVNDPDRVRTLGRYVTETKQTVAIIDHHLEPKDFADECYIDTDASSTGELIARLVERAMPVLGGTITPKGAMALYVAIMTDTGGFKFPRTDAELFRICADLLDAGADPVRAFNEVYNTSPASRLLLMRECLNSLEYHHGNRMAFQCITQAQLDSVGANAEDVDGFVQMPFQVKGIVLSVFLLELKEGWKLSNRSKNDVSAARFAQSFGGNGHFHAAGARVHGTQTLEEMKRAIIEMGRIVLEEADTRAAASETGATAPSVASQAEA